LSTRVTRCYHRYDSCCLFLRLMICLSSARCPALQRWHLEKTTLQQQESGKHHHRIQKRSNLTSKQEIDQSRRRTGSLLEANPKPREQSRGCKNFRESACGCQNYRDLDDELFATTLCSTWPRLIDRICIRKLVSSLGSASRDDLRTWLRP
jgi:hypothetical protein